ncbi:MAG: hypothetical protein KBA66_22045 [Leptospiraceae bacterium]|nr:hypothetical protein [Leptospiraceae bacterium]
MVGVDACIGITNESNIVFFVVPKPNPIKNKKKFPIWIKLLNKSETYRYHFWVDHHVDTTYSIYRFIRDLEQFEKANILYSQQTVLPENAIILEFNFSKLDEYDEWGFPSYIHSLDYEGSLIAYNSLNQEIARTPLSLRAKFRKFLFSDRTEADQRRKEMLELALQNLLEKLGEK